jgi:hypothetical protein
MRYWYYWVWALGALRSRRRATSNEQRASCLISDHGCTAPQLGASTRSTSDGPGPCPRPRPRSSMNEHAQFLCPRAEPARLGLMQSRRFSYILRSNPAQSRLYAANMQGSQLQAEPNVVQHTWRAPDRHRGWYGGALYSTLYVQQG